MKTFLAIFLLLLISLAHAQSPFDRPAMSDSIPKPPSEPGVLTFVYKQGLPSIYREALEFGLTDGQDTVAMEGISFYIDDGETWPHSKPIHTPPSGTLILWFSFVTPVGDTISSGKMEIPFRSGYIWRITFTCDSRNPTMFCSDCLGNQAFAIRDGFEKGLSDSVWVYWAGSQGGRGVFDR